MTTDRKKRDMPVQAFRAWVDPLQRMITPDSVCANGDIVYDTQHFTPEQYWLLRGTGQEDIHGDQIFEGDLIRFCNPFTQGLPLFFEIRYGDGNYDKGQSPYQGFYFVDLRSQDSDGWGFLLYKTDHIEIIGNLYEGLKR